MRPRSRAVCRWALSAVAVLLLVNRADADDAKSPRAVPRIDLIGDSTVNNGTKGLMGWGEPFGALWDPTRIEVRNLARGGRSSRTYRTEGLWDRVKSDLRPGDFVLIQFGHNDGGTLTGPRARASLKGNGEETRVVADARTGKKETVHTYGWYLRKYAAEAKARGATPIIVSPVPRNIWREDGTVARAARDYGKWAAEAAKQSGARFLDLNELVANQYEKIGRATVAGTYFGDDHTHTTEAGARVTAGIVAEALARLPDAPFAPLLKNKGH